MKTYTPRIYIPQSLKINQNILLSNIHIHYIKEVLRMKKEEILEIFNNTNYIFFAKIITINKKVIQLHIFKKKEKNRESPLLIHLGYVFSNSSKINFIIQKSIELGVNSITPLFVENNHNHKKIINNKKKIIHWNNIAVSACQQCKRNIIPEIYNPENILSWCKNSNKKSTKIIFHTKSILTINNLKKNIKKISLLIGSEKGFSYLQINKIIKYGFIPIKLGPRILRTETAVIAAITALQIQYGDLI